MLRIGSHTNLSGQEDKVVFQTANLPKHGRSHQTSTNCCGSISCELLSRFNLNFGCERHTLSCRESAHDGGDENIL